MNVFEMSIKILTILFLVGVQQQSESAAVNGDRYFVIFDAGSSGTRVQVFYFKEGKKSSLGLDFIKVTKKSSKPGLSAFVNKPERVKDGISTLINFAKQEVPKEQYGNTWCVVRATAGYRLISAAARTKITKNVEEVLRKSPFKIPEKDALRMISGQEEALYSWVSINILTNTLQNKQPTYPLLEVGGGSLQFATQVAKKTDSSNQVTFKLPNGAEYYIHLHSYLGLGQQDSALRTSGYKENGGNNQVLKNVCLAKDFKTNFSFGSVNAQMSGADIKDTERADKCRKNTLKLVKKMAVHSEKQDLKDSQPIYCISGAYYLIKALAKKYPELRIKKEDANTNQLKHRTYSLTEKTLEKAARTVCPKIPTDDKYWPFYCIYINVLTNFFRNGIEAKQSQTLKGMGNNDAIGWPLGISIDFLAKNK